MALGNQCWVSFSSIILILILKRSQFHLIRFSSPQGEVGNQCWVWFITLLTPIPAIPTPAILIATLGGVGTQYWALIHSLLIQEL